MDIQIEANSQTFTVLVVDDDAAIRRALSISLGHEGYTVLTFASAEQFLAQFRPGMYGVIILDVQMPGIAGLELQVRLGEIGADQPIIFVTGHASVPLSVQAIKRGAVDFLEKPFRRQVLLDRIREARDELDRIRAMQQTHSDLEQRIDTLTRREKQVFDLLVQEKPKASSKEIASELSISPRTADQYRASVLSKLAVTSVAELGLKIARSAVELPESQ